MRWGPLTGVQEWLAQLGLEKYAAVFAEHDISLDLLPDLTEADVDRLGLPTGPRRRLIVALESLAAERLAHASLQHAPPDGEHSLLPPVPGPRQISMLCCELATAKRESQGFDDQPDERMEALRRGRKAGAEVVARYGGHVLPHPGEGLWACFGWPNPHEDDAERCVRAAVDIVRAAKAVSAGLPLSVRVGVATGSAVVEPVAGAAADAKLTATDTRSLAERLQTLAGIDEVVIGRDTRNLLQHVFHFTDLGARPHESSAAPLAAWRVEGLRRGGGLRFRASQAGVALTPLVGREEEVALLVRRWQQAREGEGRVVLIGGEPGIGKSRLIEVLREHVARDPHVTLRYQCSPYHVHSALHPILEQMEFTARFTRDDTPERKLDKLEGMLLGDPQQRVEVARLLAGLLGLPTDRYPPLQLTPRKQKERALEAMLGQLELLAARQPLLLVFENAHWVDPTSQEALDALVPRLQALPVLLVVTHRPEYPPRWVDQAHTTMLGLARLGRRHGAELVAKVTAGKILPPKILEQIVVHADGVPLFVEELTKSVLESGLLKEAADRYTLNGSFAPLAVPTSLRDSLLARLDRLAPVKFILQIGACIGREFSYELLARIANLPHEQLEIALHKLTEAGLIYRRGIPPEAAYTFKHVLMQDAAYDFLPESRRAQLHAQIAQTLERDFAARGVKRPEVLAHHYTESGDPSAAVPWWTEAGKQALRKMALQETIAHFQRGLALLEAIAATPERDRLELSIREPLHGALAAWCGWASPEVSANASAILALARRGDSTESLLIGLWGMWINTLTGGRVAESLEWAQRLLTTGNQPQHSDLRVFGHWAAVQSHLYLGQLVEAREQAQEALALYEPERAERWTQLTAHDLRTNVSGWLSQCMWMLGFPDQAAQLSDEKDAHARRLGHPFDIGFALTTGAWVFDYRREPDRLLHCTEEADRLAREQSIPFLYQLAVPRTAGLARLRRGELDESISMLRGAIDRWESLGGHLNVPYVKSAIAEALALQGDLDAALATIEECLEQIDRPGWLERAHLAEVLRLKGWMLMRQGRGEEAETALRAALDWSRRQQAKSWELRASTTLAELLAARGQRDAARWLLAPVYGWFTEGLDTYDLVAARRLLESLA